MTAARSGRCSRSRSASASRRPGCASSSPAARLLRRPGLRRFVTAGLAVGIVAIVLELALLPATDVAAGRRLASPRLARGDRLPARRNARPAAHRPPAPHLRRGARRGARASAPRQRNAPITGSGRMRSITSATTTGERSGNHEQRLEVVLEVEVVEVAHRPVGVVALVALRLRRGRARRRGAGRRRSCARARSRPPARPRAPGRSNGRKRAGSR